MFEFAKTIQSTAEAAPVGPIRLVGTAPEGSPVSAAPRSATKCIEGNSAAINRLSWLAKFWSRKAWDTASLVRLVVAFAVLTACSWLGIVLSHQSGGVATIWLTNGMLFGLAITQPRSRWPAYFVAGLMADTIADVVYGDSFRLAIGVSLANSVEVILSCLLLTRLFGHPFNLSRRHPLLGFLVVSVVGAAALTSALGASWTLLWVVDAGPWLQLFRTWYLGDLLGMALIAPLTFMLQREDFLSILHPNRLANTLLILMVPAVTTVLVFTHKEDPLVFLLFPALLLVVFRLGFPGTVINIFLIALLSIGLTVKGYGPLMMIVGDHAILHRIVVVQIFLAVAIFTMFPVAALLEERASLQLCLQASEARYRNLASIDDLTGLFNRRAFNVRLEQEWANALEGQEPIALLLVDADLFKKYNDHFGHLAGDDCLQRVAGAIAESVSRPSSFVARFGGEEFAIILPRTGLDDARHIAESIRLAVADMRLPHPATLSGVQSVSIGVAVSVLDPDSSAPDLIGRADLALYRAKDRGRNQVVFA